MSSKKLIVTLKSDLFVDKHLLKIYKQNDQYILTEQKRVKKYYDNGIKLTNDHETIYVFEKHYETKYNTTIENIKHSDYKDLIKNPSLTNLDQATDKRIEIIYTNNKWLYNKYIKYDNDWISQFSGTCSENI